MNLMSQAFPPAQSYVERLIQLHVEQWNRVVGRRSRLIREESDRFVTLHPTKGFRHVHKRRFGMKAA